MIPRRRGHSAPETSLDHRRERINVPQIVRTILFAFSAFPHVFYLFLMLSLFINVPTDNSV